VRREVTDGGIHCPNCDSTFSRVINTELAKEAIKRRRECLECGVRWNTYECMEHRDQVLEQEKRNLIYAQVDAKTAIQNAIEKLQQIKI
jgi:transcriptional repressor NrdR